MKIIHINASPKFEDSNSYKIALEWKNSLLTKYPEAKFDNLLLFKEKIPQFDIKGVNGKSQLSIGSDISNEIKDYWKEIFQYIESVTSSDIILINTPMWNFSIPYKLKQFLDIIFQPNHLFKYTENGPQGLLTDKKAIIISSRGGDYSDNSPLKNYDLITPYMKVILGFAGIQNPQFINLNSTDSGTVEKRKVHFENAIEEAKKSAYNI